MKLVLFDKVYNVNTEEKKKRITGQYLEHLEKYVQGFENTVIKVKKLRTFDQRFELEIQGPEEQFVYNLLKKERGTIHEFEDIKEGALLKGTMTEVGKVGFGIFVDCGIFQPITDVFLSLNSLRDQLSNGKKVSLRTLIRAFEFMDHYPVQIMIKKKNLEKNELQGILAEPTLALFRKILNDNIEGIIACGATSDQLDLTLTRTDHARDVLALEEYSFLEHYILLKEGTNAPGIIKEIGKGLEGCKLGALRPQNIVSLFP